MVSPQGPEVRYVPRQETKTAPTTGASIWLVMALGFILPGAIAYSLATNEVAASIAIFLAGLAGVLMLARPFYGIVIFLLLIYGRPEELFPAITGMRLTLLVASTTLLGTWLQIFVNREKAVKTPVQIHMILFGTIAILSSTGSGDTGEAFREVGMLIVMVLMIINLVRTRESYRMFVTTLISVSTYLAVYSIYLLNEGVAYLQKDTGSNRVLTNASIFSDPNDLASALVPALPLIFMRIKQATGWRKVLYLVPAVTIIYTIFLTGSRGGMLGLMLVCAVTFIMTRKNKAFALVIAGIGLLGILAVGAGRLTNFDSQEDSANHRLLFWQNGFEELASKPLTGVGYDQYKEINFGRPPHNSFMQALVETGLPGFFFFLSLFYYAFRSRTRSANGLVFSEHDKQDLLATKIGLAGMTMSIFFLSRCYVSVTYVYLCLPLVQQVSSSGKLDVLNVDSKERFSDWMKIIGICLLIITVIKVLIFKFL